MIIDSSPPAPSSLWRTLDFLLRRRIYVLAFRRFRVRPRRPEEFPSLVPGLGQSMAAQLIQILVRARWLRRLDLEGSAPDCPYAVTALGKRMLDTLDAELRMLDALCQASPSAAGMFKKRKDGRGELRGGGWVIRKLLRQRGAMALLASLPHEVFPCDHLALMAEKVPGANAGHCLKLLTHCGILERSQTSQWRRHEYQLTEFGMRIQSLFAELRRITVEFSHDETKARQRQEHVLGEPLSKIAG